MKIICFYSIVCIVYILTFLFCVALDFSKKDSKVLSKPWKENILINLSYNFTKLFFMEGKNRECPTVTSLNINKLSNLDTFFFFYLF